MISFRRFLPALIVVCATLPASLVWSAPVTFTPDASGKPYRVSTRFKATGQSMVPGKAGQTIALTMNAAAEFLFTERRLPPAGRDALAFRAIRDFETARMESSVTSPEDSDKKLPPARQSISLPDNCRLIVAEGRLSGVSVYSPTSLMTREMLDLMELPGDTLALAALLPVRPVNVDDTWTPPDWAGQMLASIEAIESSTLSCKLTAATDTQADLTITGSIKGQRHGTNCEVAISGTISYDRTRNHVTVARLNHTVISGIGSVTPGISAGMEVETRVQPLDSPGRLTDTVLAAVPVSTDPKAEQVLFDAVPWNLRMRMSRDWHFFQQMLDGPTKVAIFRLMDRGSLISQCNVVPIQPSMPAGQHIPLGQFEKDIRSSLGERLKNITAREEVAMDNGLKVFRVVVDGEYSLTGPKGVVKIPTTWIYYLCAAPSGQQASFVFAVETTLLEQLGNRHEELVQGLQFTPERSAGRP